MCGGFTSAVFVVLIAGVAYYVRQSRIGLGLPVNEFINEYQTKQPISLKEDVLAYTQSSFPTYPNDLDRKFSAPKHVPTLQVFKNNTAKVTVPHGMQQDHYISDIFVTNQEDKVVFWSKLTPEHHTSPEMSFHIPSDTTWMKPWENCNLHGRWVGDKVLVHPSASDELK